MMRVDVVIISYAKTPELKLVTEDGIISLFSSDFHIDFNVFVVESNKEVNYDKFKNVKTIHPDEKFGYNKYLNIGISHGTAPYVFLANNDLTYGQGWASDIILQMALHPEILSASPFCPQTQHIDDWKHAEVHVGTVIRRQLAGWAIFQQRKIYNIIGKLDEGVDFWYSDNIYADQLIHNNIIHGLVISSIVNHHEFNLGKTGMSILNEAEKTEFTVAQHRKYLEARARVYSK